jgi:hypothetical protein
MKPLPNGSNDKKITFEEIAPNWSKRLDRLMTVKGSSYGKDPVRADISDHAIFPHFMMFMAAIWKLFG